MFFWKSSSCDCSRSYHGRLPLRTCTLSPDLSSSSVDSKSTADADRRQRQPQFRLHDPSTLSSTRSNMYYSCDPIFLIIMFNLFNMSGVGFVLTQVATNHTIICYMILNLLV
jgi:hypothetical protein